MAKITLIGMYQWMKNSNDDIFTNLVTPTGIDKDKLINTILMHGAEFEVLYPDAEYFKFLVGVWSDKWQHTMKKWINALSIDYNPLENYDRMEDWTDLNTKLSSQEDKRSSMNVNERSDVADNSEATSRNETALGNDTSVSTGNGTTTNTRSAFDSATYSAHDQSTSQSGGSNTASSLTSANGDTTTSGKNNDFTLDSSNGIDESKSTSMDNETGKRSGRAHGNIGVTTSQQMLEAELNIQKFNVYEEIANLFLTEFVIYTY